MAWNKPSTENQQQKKPDAKAPSAKRGVIAGAVIVVALGAMCLYFFSNGEATSSSLQKKERGRIKEVTPAAVSAVKPQKVKIPRPKSVEEAMQNIGEPKETEIRKCVIPPEELDRLTNRVFDSGVEQLLSWVCAVTPGDMPMIMPTLDEVEKKNLAGILISKISVKDNDSEEIASLKESVGFAKKEMARYIREGGDPDEFLQYYARELDNAFQYRTEVVKQVRDLCMQGEGGLAKSFCEKVNEKLAEKGIREVDFAEFEEMAKRMEECRKQAEEEK